FAADNRGATGRLESVRGQLAGLRRAIKRRSVEADGRQMKRFAAISAVVIVLAAACGTTQPTDATKPSAHSAVKREQAASVQPASFSTEASTICSSMALFSKKLVGGTGKVSDQQVGRL